ncbi:MAG: ABC transporter permease [Bryobacteraceae bacterium]
MWRDALYALRTMRKNPAFALAAVLTLSLGIGANTTIFTVVNAVLLKPLAYRDPDRLVRVSRGITFTKFEAIRQAQSFTGTGAFLASNENITLSAADGPEPLKGARVTPNFLSILGLSPLLGRSFLPGEENQGAQVAMISSELWHRRFGGDPRVVGTNARLASASYTIVGVLPAGFSFPFSDVDVWRPLQAAAFPERLRMHSPILNAFARLKPDVSPQAATAELAVIHRQYAQANPGMLDGRPNEAGQVTPMKDYLVRDIRSMLWMLFGAVGFLLLIACANVAGLLLARASSRSREFAIRAALGAGRGRIIAQLLTESLLLAIAGGGLGLLLADWSLRAVAGLPGLDLPRMEEIQLNGMVLAFAAGLSVFTSLLFGLAPALAASRPELAGVMKGAVQTTWPKRMRLWLNPRGALVVGQVALSIILLIGAALLIESLARLRQVDPGFQTASLLTMQIGLPLTRYDTTQKQTAFFEDLVRRVESVPGVRGAAVTLTLPMTGYAGTPVHLVGSPLLQLNERPIATLQAVTPGYFRTLAIPTRRGRDFEARDKSDTPFVAIINESLARRFWPAYPKGEDPVGHHLLAGANPEPLQIVGVVADVRQGGLADEATLGIYRPRSQTQPLPAMFAVRTTGDPLRYAYAIRSQVTAIDRDQAVTNVKSMEQVVEASEGQRQTIMILLAVFAGIGLLLAVVGIYGVIAYSVAQRTKELGIRRALGAKESDILKLVLEQALGLTIAGAVLGIAGAVALTRLLQGLLFGVSPTDSLTFGGITFLLILVALAASYVPARRAARVDPSTALRIG